MNRVVITNGVFDVFHAGHAELLAFCKSQGDFLVVALDTDRRVKQIKGSSRPVNNQRDRQRVLESCRFVDRVVLFDSIEQLQELYITTNASILVKGDERSPDDLRRIDDVPEHIDIRVFPHVSGLSTTNLIQKIRELPTHEKIIDER